MADLHTSHPGRNQAGRAVAVHTAPDQLTAELLRGLLEDAGIPAVLAAGDTMAYFTGRFFGRRASVKGRVW